MTYKEQVLKEINDIPENMLTEILDFVKFLKQKVSAEKYEITSMSESSLKKNWLKPEEELAWKHL